MTKNKAGRNKTITLSEQEREIFSQRLLHLSIAVPLESILNRTIQQDVTSALNFFPAACIDLLFIDPPYNLKKNFKSNSFKAMSSDEYAEWMDAWLSKIVRCLKPTASIYICGDWRSSGAIERGAEKYFITRNRITWEREKGRGAKANWKNASEDIWYCTRSEKFTFNLDAVKLKRKVLAPYTSNGKPKDWNKNDDGNFRLTHPSNLWTDITVPFWSMPENTEHPTQKPEKLLAKIILASSNEGDVVMDSFLGSGTTSVVAKKMNRKYIGIELDETFACLAEKRLHSISDSAIQGMKDGIFYERNAL